MTQRLARYWPPLFLLLAPLAKACSLVGCVDSGIELRGDFTVLITHERKPLQGVKVEIKPLTSHVGNLDFTVVTGVDGKASVNKLAPGEYWLIVGHLGIGAAYHCFHVAQRPSKKAKRALTYSWGDLAPATRRVAGRLIDSQPGTGGTPLWNILNRANVPIIGAALHLQNATTGEEFRIKSGDQGDFAFDAIPNGTYVLHIEGGTTGRGYDPTDLLMKVRGNATRSAVELKRQEPVGTNCGDSSLVPSWN